MNDISRREFGRFAAEVGTLGLTGTLAACGAPSTPPRAEPAATTPPTPNRTPDTRTRRTKLTQADLDRIIGDHAHTLLDHLRSRAPGPTQEPLGIAILVNGDWRKDDPGVIADNHGPAMLKQISAAI